MQLVTTCVALLGCSVWLVSGTPEDPEKMQRTLAAANLRRFPESLLQEALFPNHDPRKSVSREDIQRLLESTEGQEAARSAAMRAMLAETPSDSRMAERSRDAAVGWLGRMCDSVPWLAWLVECEPSAELPAENRDTATELPFVLTVNTFEWATCPEMRNVL